MLAARVAEHCDPDAGPVGWPGGGRADSVIVTGGAALDSPVDIISGHRRRIYGFIGIGQLDIFGADRIYLDSRDDIGRAAAVR